MDNQVKRSRLIRAAVSSMTRSVTNETQAWNLWNNLNTDEDFIRAFLDVHSEQVEERVHETLWELLEEQLEGPLKLDLNRLDQNQQFHELVNELTKSVMNAFQLKEDD